MLPLAISVGGWEVIMALEARPAIAREAAPAGAPRTPGGGTAVLA